MTPTETTQTERPTRLVGVLMPPSLAAELKETAWQQRTTVSDLLRQATALLLAAQKEGAQ